MGFSEDPLFQKVSGELLGFQKRYLERIEVERQRLKACKINTVIQSKRAQELKLNAQLKNRLMELSKKSDDLDRICTNFASGLTISDSDQHRLDNAKEMYEIGKKLTGIRFDFSASPEVVKGYSKSEIRRTLTPFQYKAEETSEQLWDLIQTTTGDNENVAPN